MYDDLSESPGHFRYRSFLMISSVAIGLLMCGTGLFLLISTILGKMESQPFEILFLIIWIGIATYIALGNVTAVETSSAGLKIEYLFKAKHIPWQDIHDMRIRQGNPKWCEIKYSRLPIRRVTFFLDYSWHRGLSKSNLLLNSIIGNADLKLVDQDFWGLPIYKRGESFYE